MSDRQWIRKYACTIGDININPELKAKFRCSYRVTQTPDICEFTVLNLTREHSAQCRQTKGKVLILAAGYKNGAFGPIYKGIVQKVIANGRLNPVDTFTTIWATSVGPQGEIGKGNFYTHAESRTTLKPGSTGMDVYKYLLTTWPGLKQGNIPTDALKKLKFPRGITLFGDTKDQLRKLAVDVNSTWHLDGLSNAVNIIPVNSKGQRNWEVNSKTGMIGTPQQTNLGVVVRVLLNPNIKVDDMIRITEPITEIVPEFGITSQPTQASKQLNLSANGIYRVIAINQDGDSRGEGNDWYTELIAASEHVYPDAARLGWS
jgi:hypothetical protein